MTRTFETRVKMIHFADPWCWWSWGLEPVLARLKELYGEGIEIEYRMGGIFDDVKDWWAEYGVDEDSTVDWVRDSIGVMGNPVDPEYMRKTRATSTYPGCRAFKAAELQDREKAHVYFRRMMESIQVRAETPDEARLLRLARECGLDPERLRTDMGSQEVEEAFASDRRAMERSGLNFLSLLVQAGGHQEARSEVFTSGPFEEIIDRLAPSLPRRIPVDILEYVEKTRGLMSAHEISEVFHIPEEDAAARLAALEDAGLLRRDDHGGASFWSIGEIRTDKLPLEVVKIAHVPPEARIEMTSDLTPIVTAAVQNLYTEVATRPNKTYHFPLGLEAVRFVGYPEDLIAKLPPAAVESFAGVGYPFATESIRPGDTVLDIGSGSGTDILFASLRTGPKGQVFGLDFTPAMIEKARANIVRMGATNVQILEGNATAIPVPDASVDAVTSNGVLNLVPDKAAAFREIFRVLKPGGRLQLADIVVQEDVGAVCGLNPQLWADCIGGAAVEAEYLGLIQSTGFQEVRVVRRLDYFSKSHSENTKRLTKSFGAESVVIAARRP